MRKRHLQVDSHEPVLMFTRIRYCVNILNGRPWGALFRDPERGRHPHISWGWWSRGPTGPPGHPWDTGLCKTPIKASSSVVPIQQQFFSFNKKYMLCLKSIDVNLHLHLYEHEILWNVLSQSLWCCLYLFFSSLWYLPMGGKMRCH